MFSNRKLEVKKKHMDWEDARTKLRHCKSNEKTAAFLIAMDTMREHGKWDG